MVLGPLEEAAVGDVPLERVAINEGVGVRTLAGARRTRRPRTREDEAIVLGAQQFGDGVLPDPTGAGDDNDQGLEPSSRTSSFSF